MALKSVEEYIAKHFRWEKELKQLHDMMLNTELEPNIKWGSPVYSFNGKNVVGLSGFKNHYGLWFFNGALLKKNTALLLNAQDGKTKAMRQIRLTANDELNIDQILPYVKEAIQNQKEGKEIKASNTKKLVIPEEFGKVLRVDKELNTSFQELTPGKQREYADYISEAKQAKTKLSRIKKITPMIKRGVGLNDKYKNC